MMLGQELCPLSTKRQLSGFLRCVCSLKLSGNERCVTSPESIRSLIPKGLKTSRSIHHHFLWVRTNMRSRLSRGELSYRTFELPFLQGMASRYVCTTSDGSNSSNLGATDRRHGHHRRGGRRIPLAER